MNNPRTQRLITVIIGVHVGGPERQVVAQQLHDERRVLVGLLAQRVQLGDRVVERRLGQPAGALRRVEDLVVEDGEVECEAEADGVGRRQLGHRDVCAALYATRLFSAASFRSLPVANSAR